MSRTHGAAHAGGSAVMRSTAMSGAGGASPCQRELAGLGLVASQAEVPAGGGLQGVGGADVALDEHGQPPVSGLGGDPVEASACARSNRPV
jgi:hypothetical protein